MKKSSFKLFISAVAAMLLTGCMVEEIAIDETPASLTRTFTAEFAPQTKTSLEMDGTTGKVLWEVGDAISVLDGVSNVKVVLAADNIISGGSKAVFSLDVAPGTTYYAVYPYSAENSVSKGELVTVKPSAIQDGSFSSCHISAGEFTSESSTFTFHNVVSVLKFSQTSKDIARITFGANSGDRLFDDVTSVEVTTGAAGTYYFSLPAFSLSKGFTIKAFDASGEFKTMAVTDKEISLAAGEGLNLGSLDDHFMEVISDADFNDLPTTDKANYIITGAITEIEDDVYGDFYINDGTGTVYIYGLLTPDGETQKQFKAAGLGLGDEITVYGAKTIYKKSGKEIIEMKNATYISHKKASHDYLMGQSKYGVYSETGKTAYFTYEQFLDQIGVGAGVFRMVNPNTVNWLSVTGLPSEPAVDGKYSVSVEQNYSGSLPSKSTKELTVGKIEDDSMTGVASAKKVWLYGSDGVGYIVRLSQDNIK